MPFLTPGDTIGVIAPAGVPDMSAVEAGMAALRAMGYAIKPAQHLQASWRHSNRKNPEGYNYAGTPQQRAADIHEMFDDDDVKLIIAVRGGYGSDDVVPLLDADRIRDNPKPLMGYSDVTYLLSWLDEHCGTPAWHGPMVARDFAWPGGVDLESFRNVIANDRCWQLSSGSGLVQVRPGHCRGTLRGGCLSVLVRSFDTESFSRYTAPQHLQFLHALESPTVLFLEDTDETPQAMHSNWEFLKQRLNYKQIKGVIFGYMLQRGRIAESFRREIESMFALEDIPVAFGLRSGHLDQDLAPRGAAPSHVQANITLPFGGTVELLCNESATLQIYPYAGSQ